MSEQIYIERYWRDATPADAISEPPMVARFRDKWESDKDWVIGKLIYWDRSRVPWNGEKWDCFERCQVYDAPDPGEGWRLIDPEKESPEEGDEFFEHGYWKTRRAKTDPFAKTFYYRRRIQPPKPDPGEGWRLIDTEKETPKNGDEFLLTHRNEWITIVEHPSRRGFAENYIYRRRIEQPKPEPKYEPFRWEDREQLRGRWITITLSCGEVRECQIEFLRLERNVFYVGSFTSDQLLEKNARFLDTGEPVGKRVE